MNKQTEKIAYDVSEYALIIGGAEIALTQFTDFSIMGLLSGIHELAIPIAAGIIGAAAVYQLYTKFFKK